LLRQHAAATRTNDLVIDWPNIIEEIESVGRSERLAVASHVAIILERLAKLEASPAAERRNGWRQTVRHARAAIDEVLEECPSLRPTLGAVIKRGLGRRPPLVANPHADYGETPRVNLHEIDYTIEQVLGPWLPGDPDLEP
jgi:hypothetical protein